MRAGGFEPPRTMVIRQIPSLARLPVSACPHSVDLGGIEPHAVMDGSPGRTPSQAHKPKGGHLTVTAFSFGDTPPPFGSFQRQTTIYQTYKSEVDHPARGFLPKRIAAL